MHWHRLKINQKDQETYFETHGMIDWYPNLPCLLNPHSSFSTAPKHRDIQWDLGEGPENLQPDKYGAWRIVTEFARIHPALHPTLNITLPSGLAQLCTVSEKIASQVFSYMGNP